MARTMKAAIATGIQDIDQYLHVQDDWPQPTLVTAIDGKTGKLVSELHKKRKTQNDSFMVVKVLACALAPGDCRLFGGKTDLAQLPKTGRPYVIGSDICGIVTEVFEAEASDENNQTNYGNNFKVGDKVIARFDEPQPHGMCAEFACVKTSLSEHCPASIPAIQACTLPASAAAAKLVATRYIKPNDRVLVLGASGGVGTFLCQYVKCVQGASFLAATTTQTELATSILGVDRVIDYRKENWWELEAEFQNEPFDVVVDLVNGTLNWPVGACSSRTKVLKPGAPYLQLLTGVETELDMRSILFNVIPFVFRLMVSRPLYCKFHPKGPQWIAPQGLDLQPGDLKGILEDITETRIKVVLDPSSPFSFDTQGVRDAMKLQHSIHAHGKVVIEIAKDDGSKLSS